MTTETIKITQANDPETGMTYIEAQVDDTMRVRVYSNFEMSIIDQQPGVAEPDVWTLPVAQFRRSFEALMAEMEMRYGGKP